MKEIIKKDLDELRNNIIKYWEYTGEKNIAKEIKEMEYEDLIHIAAITASVNYVRWKQELEFEDRRNKENENN